MPSAIAESGSVPLNGQVAPREKRLGERIRLGVLTEEIRPELVDEVVELTGCGERRRRLLPARAVVYFVLALCLFSSSDSAGPPGYRSVLRTLTQKLPTSSALTRAAAAGRQTAAGAVRAAVRHAGHGPHSGGVRLRAAAGRLGRHRAGRPRDTGERGRVRLHRQGKCQPERASTGSRAGCWPPCDRTCCCRPTATSADTSCGARPAPPAPTWPGGSHQEAAQERLRGQKKTGPAPHSQQRQQHAQSHQTSHLTCTDALTHRHCRSTAPSQHGAVAVVLQRGERGFPPPTSGHGRPVVGRPPPGWKSHPQMNRVRIWKALGTWTILGRNSCRTGCARSGLTGIRCSCGCMSSSWPLTRAMRWTT
ncbi:transposase domain-containing protein [Streptomyces sp. 110]|uniref:Transposase domain-containing protein n=1 Tax=Streptomyces endocoffeicus TaxID=2898945 RepID=A0ABS1PFA0_9ACTN|nr:transposase domain-containing protein [Streptomyces endocoffeicus]